MELFKLLGTVAIDNSDANNALESTGSKLKKSIATVGKWGLAFGAAAVAAGTAMVGFASKAAAVGDRVDKMSQKIGISREAYQELDFVCSQAGTSVDTLQMGVKTLTNQMQAAADGTDSAVEIFHKLGVSIYDANGQLKDQETMMWEAMQALQNMENQTEKAALANDLFGRSGSELMPLLNGASGSIEAMREQAHELGLVMSDEFVDDSVAFTDTMDQIKRSVSAMGTSILGKLLPHIQSLGAKFVEIVPVIGAFIENGLQKVADVAGDVSEFWYEVLQPAFMAVWDSIVLVWEALEPVIQSFTDLLPKVETTKTGMDYFRDACLLVEDALLWVANKLTVVSEWMKQNKPIVEMIVLVLGSLAAAWVVVNGAITIWNTVAGIATTITTGLGTAIGFLTSPIGIAVVAVTALIAIGVALYKNWDTVKSKCTELWQNVVARFTAIKEGVASIFQQLVSAVKTPVNTIIGFINGLTSGVTSGINAVINALNRLQIDVPDWVTDLTGLTAFGFNIKTLTAPQIPLLERGGILEKGQVGLLEGKGAEAVVPLDRNSAWISRVADDMRTHGIGDSEIMDKVYEKLNELYALLAFYIPALSKRQILLDTGTLIGELAPGMDEALGELAQMDDRGV